MAKKKNINKSRLERMSVEELKSLNKNINQRPKPPESKKPKPPDMFGTCREEKQLLQEISTLPVQEMLSRIENYLETNKPCINITPPTPYSSDDTREEIICGDVNGDGLVNILDLTPFVRHILGESSLDTEQLCKADVNGDGYADLLDVVTIVNSIINEEPLPNSCSSSGYCEQLFTDYITKDNPDDFSTVGYEYGGDIPSVGCDAYVELYQQYSDGVGGLPIGGSAATYFTAVANQEAIQAAIDAAPGQDSDEIYKICLPTGYYPIHRHINLYKSNTILEGGYSNTSPYHTYLWFYKDYQWTKENSDSDVYGDGEWDGKFNNDITPSVGIRIPGGGGNPVIWGNTQSTDSDVYHTASSEIPADELIADNLELFSTFKDTIPYDNQFDIPQEFVNNINVGDLIQIRVIPGQNFADYYNMDGLWNEPGSQSWNTDEDRFNELSFFIGKVEGVDGNTITVDNPLRHTFENHYDKISLYKINKYLHHVGIKNLKVSNTIYHDDIHRNKIQKPGGIIGVSHCQHCFIDNVDSYSPREEWPEDLQIETFGSTYIGATNIDAEDDDPNSPSTCPPLGPIALVLEKIHEVLYPDYYDEDENFSDCLSELQMTNEEACMSTGGCTWIPGNGFFPDSCYGDASLCKEHLLDGAHSIMASIKGSSNYSNVENENRHIANHGITLSHACNNVTIKNSSMNLPQLRGAGGEGYLFYLTAGPSNILIENCSAYRGRHNFLLVSPFTQGIVLNRITSKGGWGFSDFDIAKHLTEKIPAHLYYYDSIGSDVEREDMGKIQNDQIVEASGIVASRHNLAGSSSPDWHSGVFWTHNDNGTSSGEDLPTSIYAFDNEGNHIGEWNINNSTLDDWEDMATHTDSDGNSWLYIGNIGKHREPDNPVIYKCPEPIHNGITWNINPNDGLDCEFIEYTYPNQDAVDEIERIDSETLMVDTDGTIYVIVKHIIILNLPSRIFKIPETLDENGERIAEDIGSIGPMPGTDIGGNIPWNQITSGDISVNGDILIQTYEDIFYYERGQNQSFIDALNNEPQVVSFQHQINEMAEAVSWNQNGTGYYTISEEGRPSVEDLVEASGINISLMEAEMEFWSRALQLELTPFGHHGFSDTHQGLAGPILVTDSDIWDGWDSSNRHNESGNAGLTGTGNIFWNIRGNPNPHSYSNSWKDSNNMSLLRSFQPSRPLTYDEGGMVIGTTDMEVVTHFDTDEENVQVQTQYVDRFVRHLASFMNEPLPASPFVCDCSCHAGGINSSYPVPTGDMNTNLSGWECRTETSSPPSFTYNTCCNENEFDPNASEASWLSIISYLMPRAATKLIKHMLTEANYWKLFESAADECWGAGCLGVCNYNDVIFLKTNGTAGNGGAYCLGMRGLSASTPNVQVWFDEDYNLHIDFTMSFSAPISGYLWLDHVGNPDTNSITGSFTMNYSNVFEAQYEDNENPDKITGYESTVTNATSLYNFDIDGGSVFLHLIVEFLVEPVLDLFDFLMWDKVEDAIEPKLNEAFLGIMSKQGIVDMMNDLKESESSQKYVRYHEQSGIPDYTEYINNITGLPYPNLYEAQHSPPPQFGDPCNIMENNSESIYCNPLCPEGVQCCSDDNAPEPYDGRCDGECGMPCPFN